MEQAFEIGIVQGFFFLETLVSLYQTSKSLHRFFTSFSVQLHHVPHNCVIPITNTKAWYALFTATKCHWALDPMQFTLSAEDITIMLLALGFVDLAAELHKQAQLKIHCLVAGIELNGSIQIYTEFCEKFEIDREHLLPWLMRWPTAPLFSDAQLRAGKLFENWITSMSFAYDILDFIENIHGCRSQIGLRYLLAKFQTEPPSELTCNTWKGIFRRYCGWPEFLNNVTNLLKLYSEWKIAEAEELVTILKGVKELIQYRLENSD